MDECKTRTVAASPQGRDYGKLIARAGKLLRRGGLVAFPTETVYGLGANAERADVLERLRQVKGRPEGKAFTFVIHELEEVERRVAAVPSPARTLMEKLWPGPLTLVLCAGEGKTVGFRMPDDRIALDVIRSAGVRLVAPSANVSGGDEPRTAQDVERQLGGRIELVLDGGPTRLGVPSTVVLVTDGSCEVLRAGAIAEKTIREIVKER